MTRERITSFLENLVFRRRPVVLGLFAVATVFMAWSASHLRVDAGFQKNLPHAHPYMETFLKHQQEFGGANRVLVALMAREGDIFTPEFFDVLRRATDEVFFLPGVDRSRVQSLFTPNVRYTEVVEDGIAAGNVIPDDFEPDDEGLDHVRRNVLKAGIVGRLVANDFTGTIISAELLEFDPATGEKLDFIAVSRAIEEKVRRQFDAEYVPGSPVDVRIIGFAKVVGAISEGTRRVILFFLIAYFLAGFLVYVYSRSHRLSFVALGCSTVAVVWQLGLLTLLGYGIADGKDRASKALRNALSSPLLDQGSLLKEARTVLVHLSGGESLTLFEIELLMRSLQKHVPETAHVLFGAAIDPAMGDNLSITLISALPEDALTTGARDSISQSLEPSPAPRMEEPSAPVIESPFTEIDSKPEPPLAEKAPEPAPPKEEPLDLAVDFKEPESPPKLKPRPQPSSKISSKIGEGIGGLFSKPQAEEPEPEPDLPEKEERPFAEFDMTEKAAESEPEPMASHSSFVSNAEPKNRAADKPLWGKSEPTAKPESDDGEPPFEGSFTPPSTPAEKTPSMQLKLDPKFPAPQSELAFDSAPKGRFEGETPNVFEGEDLDLPPFLRKKKS